MHDIIQLLLLSLDNFLAEVRTLGQFLLHLLVDLNLALVRLNLLFHLVVLVDKNFGLLGLMLQFGGKLMILEDSQVSGRLQLLVIHSQ